MPVVVVEQAAPSMREGPSPAETWLNDARRHAAVRLRAVLGFEALKRRMAAASR